MTFRPLIAAAALAATAMFQAPSNATETPEMNETQKQILKTIETMTSDFQNADYDNVLKAYEASASVAFEPGNPVSDPDALRKGFEMFGAVQPKFTYAGHEVIVEGDLAVHIAPWSMTGTAPDGTALAQNGLSVAVLRKQPDGSWKMVIDNPHGQRLMPQ
ncbi:YybH family protein [Roseibium sp.]|uniref:YybH family protein n=1 Tax=Roseibium sp. TaxID=1936156 RepID=UPI003A97165F